MTKTSWTPSTLISNRKKQLREKHYYIAKRATKKMLKALMKIKSIDAKSKAEIKKSFTHHALHAIAVNIWFNSIETFTIGLVILATFATWALAPYQIMTRLLEVQNIPWYCHILAPLLSVPLFLLLFNPTLLNEGKSITSELDEKARPIFTNIAIVGITYSVFLTKILLPLLPTPSLSALLATYALVGALSITAFLYCLSTISAYCLVLAKRKALSIRPEATVVDRLLTLLLLLEQHPDRGLDSKEKRKILKSINETANAITQAFSEHARASDQDTAIWSRERGDEFAGSVRALAKWVVTPDRNTRENIKQHVAKNFICAVRGDWDNFSRTPISSQPRRFFSKHNAVLTLRTLLSSATPIAILVTLKKFDIIPEQVSSYFAVGAYLWSALTLLAHLDPNYSSKLSALKEAAQALSVGKKT
ncbi:hypothetical protein HPC50_10735 [Corallococcus exiguus]|uniref:hypothetical protein n=1 Tax=Corallococcus TaxID=83461 RepID=UPI0011C3BCB9|nr:MULTISPECIES: hypothetical protein [Corallococcus]NPC47544.1 hypothetical protein [Corallococcus exiguus]